MALAACHGPAGDRRQAAETPANPAGPGGAGEQPRLELQTPAPDAPGGLGGETAEPPQAAPEPEESDDALPGRPPLVRCPARRVPSDCELSGDPRHGLRLIGTLLEPGALREGGMLDIGSDGLVRCAACDCGDAGGALVIDCPGLLVSPGFLNLHDHLGYAGTPPLPHPGELYQHRSDWRLGERGHPALPFHGGASPAQVLAQELRMAMGGATALVGAGGKRGLLRNLEVAGLSEGLLPGRIRAETFPLDDAGGALEPENCRFGAHPDSPELIQSARAYVAHLGEGTDLRAQEELRCALGPLGLLGPNAAVVHAMALTRSAASALAAQGASVVWSPRSNLDLYGSTAPVALLASLGVHIALGTDWLASGSMNLLRELSCAQHYDQAALGGYFGAYELWRMVTENPAWALGLEGQLGALAPGLAADIAVFQGAQADAYASVIQAGATDVKLVLRQGQPVYGDASWVAALAGEECEALAVCGEPRRACVAGTGLSLAAIQQAGETVYPLFSCELPPAEPSCNWLPTQGCPAGEATCPAPAALPPFEARDADADGVSDATDLCPRSPDPEQVDSDGDARGDACDACPVFNPGLAPCPTPIRGMRAPSARLPLGTPVLLSGARVTAVRAGASKGYYVEDGDRSAYSGLFVYTGSKTPSVGVGDLVSLQGYFDSYQQTDELIDAELLVRDSSTPDYAPLPVTLASIADGSEQAPGLASMLVAIREVEVAATNPDAPSDYDETELAGGLRLDDQLYPELDNELPIGARFGVLQGISGVSFGHRKLWPRGPEDCVRE